MTFWNLPYHYWQIYVSFFYDSDGNQGIAPGTFRTVR
jgi:hypothetical protein